MEEKITKVEPKILYKKGDLIVSQIIFIKGKTYRAEDKGRNQILRETYIIEVDGVRFYQAEALENVLEDTKTCRVATNKGKVLGIFPTK